MTATNAWLRMVFKASPNESYYSVNVHFFVLAAAAAPPGSVYEFVWAEYGSISWVIELILSCTGAVPHCSAGRMDCLIELDRVEKRHGVCVCECVHVCARRLSVSSHKIDTPQCSPDYCRTANCLSNNLPPQPYNTHSHVFVGTHTHMQRDTGQAAQKPFPIPGYASVPQICYILILSRLRFAPIQLEPIDERAERIGRLLIRPPHL